MLGKIDEVIDNTVKIKLDIDITEQQENISHPQDTYNLVHKINT